MAAHASDDRRAQPPQAASTGGLNPMRKHASDDRRAQPPQAASTGGLNPMRKLVLMGEIGRPHGVRGLVRLHAFTADPRAIGGYGPLTDVTGARRFVVTPLPGGLGRIEGIADRDAAARLTGTKLYIERDRLPAPADPDEFLLCDLEGLTAFDAAGAALGTVRGVENYGAGDILAIEGPGGEVLVPFTRVAVPVVDVAGGRVVVAPPPERIVPPHSESELAPRAGEERRA
jgi:16S rRNA processing protein RimM